MNGVLDLICNHVSSIECVWLQLISCSKLWWQLLSAHCRRLKTTHIVYYFQKRFYRLPIGYYRWTDLSQLRPLNILTVLDIILKFVLFVVFQLWYHNAHIMLSITRDLRHRELNFVNVMWHDVVFIIVT